MRFVPVILGTDVNAYGMARAFHMEYGVKSVVVGQGKLFMTDNSSILTIKIIENLTGEGFADKLIDYAKMLRKKYGVLILIASSDQYAELCIANREKLSEYFSMPFAKTELLNDLVDKKSFYEKCEEYGLDYPDTTFVSKENYETISNPYGYPVVLKASNSIKYIKLDFDGKKKAFILSSEDEIKTVLKAIYETTDYDDYMILQDYIPGDDSNMYVLNVYVNSKGNMSLMCLGHSLMEDPSPDLIGNYLAIVRADVDGVYPMYQKFLENIGYTGFANFDMKYDRRDGKYKVFEINLRQGRSSFFTTLAGANLSRALVEDFVEGKTDGEIIYPTEDFLWLGANFDIIHKYVENPEYKALMEDLNKRGLSQNTLFYKEDMNLFRKNSLKKYYDRYEQRFKDCFVKKE